MNWNRLKKMAIAALLITAALYLGHAFWLNRRFRTQGVETMGLVTRVYTKTEYRTERVTRRTSRRVKTTAWFVDYRFEAGDSLFAASQRLGRTYADIRKGDSVLVCYLPDDPARSRLAFDEEGRHVVKRCGRRH